jgi:hypothetical protein
MKEGLIAENFSLTWFAMNLLFYREFIHYLDKSMRIEKKYLYNCCTKKFSALINICIVCVNLRKIHLLVQSLINSNEKNSFVRIENKSEKKLIEIFFFLINRIIIINTE